MMPVAESNNGSSNSGMKKNGQQHVCVGQHLQHLAREIDRDDAGCRQKSRQRQCGAQSACWAASAASIVEQASVVDSTTASCAHLCISDVLEHNT
jgi:hypothetical protein